MLIQLFFFILMLFAVAGLYIDMGLARLTQTQMQNIADTAALEGLRGRDGSTASPGAPCTSGDLEADRRCQAAKFAAWNSGTDFDPNAQLGAGPDVVLESGVAGDLDAERLIEYDPSRVYRPNLQSNSRDVPHGDMVSGLYDRNAVEHVERHDYTRTDFAPADSSRNSFLVRLRRTDHRRDITDNFDRDSNADPTQGVSSSGEALPLLFSRASAIQKDPNTATNPREYSPREQGLTIRATAIADARPARRVGTSDASPQGLGATTFSLSKTCWTSLPIGEAVLDTACPPATLPTGQRGLSIGELVVRVAPSRGDTGTLGGYLPIFDSNGCTLPPGGDPICPIVGFGFVQVTGGGTKIIRQPLGVIATANATGLAAGSPSSGVLTPDEGALLVPVLVR